MPSTSKTQRWLDLIAYLAGRRMPVRGAHQSMEPGALQLARAEARLDVGGLPVSKALSAVDITLDAALASTVA